MEIKGIQPSCIDERTFTGRFETNRIINLDDYEQICANWDVHEDDKVSFLKFFLANGPDTRQFRSLVVSRSKQIQSVID